jgi:choline dehydrogenase-like flavoprotein
MLDAGTQLEPERSQVVERLARSTPEHWTTEDREWLKSGMSPDATGIPEKLLFGSDYPYRGADQQLGITTEQVGLRASLAMGGLSTVWGSAMLPYHAGDILAWPIAATLLDPHYRAVLELTGISAKKDDLSEWFPLFTDSSGQLDLSRQATQLWNRLEKNRERLRAQNIYFGRARVAIKAARAPDETGCVYCGMCMYGCPYGYIYNSASTLGTLQRSEKFTYRPDVVVSTVGETSAGVTIYGHRRVSDEPLEIQADRVFLAAGVIPTTGILLRSLKLFDRSVRMKDSQYFLLPLVLAKHIGKVREEKSHALSQIFLEIMCPQTVHLQVYSYNDLIGKAVRKSFGPLRSAFEPLARELENRLLLIQGFIHSEYSSEIAVALRPSAGGVSERLELKPIINPEARKVVGGVVRKLMKNSLKLGAIPLPMLLQFAEPGRSFHSGGTFPMREKPGEFETDILGRPAGWRRIHAVDATVFPSIAATTITFTAMATAHRIGSQSP